MEKSKAGTKKSPNGLSHPNQNTIVSQLDLILIDEASADRLFRLAKKEDTIQYGYRTWGTHARVFSEILAHGNNKNEIRQRDRRRHTEERREY